MMYDVAIYFSTATVIAVGQLWDDRDFGTSYNEWPRVRQTPLNSAAATTAAGAPRTVALIGGELTLPAVMLGYPG